MTYHILNGDALADRFPESIEGEIIIMRECLVDGPIITNSIKELFHTRAKYLDQTYSLQATNNYNDFVLTEMNKIINIPANSDIYLWFEEDVFCQVNCWFLCYLLEQHLGENDIYFVMPDSEIEWGFAGLDEHDLIIALGNAIQITGVELIELAKLWQAYQIEDIVKMRELTKELSRFEWIKIAVDAEIDRIVENTPSQILLSLVDQFGSENFGSVFKEFCKLGAIYGYGDLMVKRLFDEIIANQNK